jgi:hypothetical protein
MVIACSDCGVHWYEGETPAMCSNSEHAHQRIQVHRHRDLVTLPDGTAVWAVSFDARNPYGRDDDPDYGLYLDDRWQPPWPHDHVDWPDFGVPVDRGSLASVLRSLHEQASGGKRVELGCAGGHGRTGTALACLAVLCGHPADDAVTWVRAAYCPHAVETPDQEEFVMEFARSLDR